MNIKKVDDKPMVIHTKEKTKLHIKQEPEAKIEGRNVLVVDKGLKIAGMDREDKTVIKKTSAKEAVKNSIQKEKGMYAQVQRAKQDREKAIDKKNSTAKTVASAGAMTALDQVDGGNEVYRCCVSTGTFTGQHCDDIWIIWMLRLHFTKSCFVAIRNGAFFYA